jgi:hypothetical protein
MSELNTNDYKQILEFYNLPIPRTSSLIKTEAEKILSDKLCRCIKKLEPIKESRAIGICTKTIFNRKGLTRGKFNCKGKKNIIIKKFTKNMTKRFKNKK